MAVILDPSKPNFWEKFSTAVGKGTLFVAPTDTLWGFASLYSDSLGRKRLEAIKQRRDSQFIVLVHSIEEAKTLASINERVLQVLKQYWPGKITFILPSLKGRSTIALRCPKDTFTRAMLQKLGEPLLSTSCNRHGESPVQSVLEAIKRFENEVDFYVGGPSLGTSASTLVDLSSNPFRVVRKGEVPFQLTVS